MRFMSWPSTCFDHPNLATTIFWNPTKPTMPAAWLVREEKPALYHWVPGNFSGPQRTDKTGRSTWSKSPNFECSPYSVSFAVWQIWKPPTSEIHSLQATRLMRNTPPRRSFNLLSHRKKIWSVEIMQHAHLSFHQREVQVVERIKVPPALPAPQGPAMQRPGASLGHMVADW